MTLTRSPWVPSVLAFVATVGTARDAECSLRVKWDCYLPTGRLDCAMLESSLTSKIPFLTVVHDAKAADVVVKLSSVPAEDSTRFVFDFEGTPVDGYATTVHSTDKIPFSIDSATATVRVMTKLERGLDDFMDQKEAAEVQNGVLVLRLLDPARLPFSGRHEQSATRWYLSPSVGAYFSDVQGVGVNASGNAGVAVNYSGDHWRLQQSISANYSQQSQPVPNTDGETASISFAGANANDVISRDLTNDHRWSVGLLLAAEKNPQANYDFRANGSIGLEFDLVPRQTVNRRNLGFHCGVGPELQHYDAANSEGVERQVVARQFCDIFLSWHFDPIDLWASIGENTILENFDYRSLTAGLSATWRVTERFMISPWINAQGINKAINEAAPTNTVYATPQQEIEASMKAAVQQAYTAPFGVQSGLSLKYVFGNGSLSVEDQRWKGATSLR